MPIILIDDDAPQKVRTALGIYEITSYAGVAGMFAADRPRRTPMKVWTWEERTPVGKDERHKAASRKRKQKKRARKSRRGY